MSHIDINDLIVGIVLVIAIGLLFWGISRRGEGKNSSREDGAAGREDGTAVPKDGANPNPWDPWGY